MRSRISITTLRTILKTAYGFDKFSLKKLVVRSHHPLFLLETSTDRYIVKAYSVKRLERLERELTITSSLSRKFPFIPRYRSTTTKHLFVFLPDGKTMITVQEYCEGVSRRSRRNLSPAQLQHAAYALAELHNLPLDRKNVASSSMEKDVRTGKEIYASVLKKLSRSSKKHDVIVREALARRLARGKEIDARGLDIGHSSLVFIHGDYAPANLIFEGARVAAVIDWEHANIYPWQYDVFRACSGFASSGRYTSIESMHDLSAIRRFLGHYFSKRRAVTTRELDVLRQMPRLFCFINSFPFGALYLEGRSDARHYLPRTPSAYTWWERHEEEFQKIVTDTYAYSRAK